MDRITRFLHNKNNRMPQSGYQNILIILAISLPLNIILTLFTGYFLASKQVLLKPIIQFLIMFTMFFSGGMIPIYLNIRDHPHHRARAVHLSLPAEVLREGRHGWRGERVMP